VRAHVIRFFGEADTTDARPASHPGLNFHDNFTAKFSRSGHGFSTAQSSATTWDHESVGSENGFALVFVKSCHVLVARF
jgi:hypothetical protein